MRKLIIANWKMNPGTAEEAEEVFGDIQKFASKLKNTEVVICPPFVYLDRLSQKLHITRYRLRITLGSQDAFWQKSGSYTGEISIPMLKNLGVKHVIIGHSERRMHLGETNEMINKKIRACLKANLKVLFCVGEEERDEGAQYFKFIKKEIIEGLDKISRNDLKNLIAVYEPIWAISSSRGAIADTPEDLFQMTIYIKKVLVSKFGRKIGQQIPIIYGGSADAKNAKDFMERGNIQGVLVGRASWKSKSFIDLLKHIS